MFGASLRSKQGQDTSSSSHVKDNLVFKQELVLIYNILIGFRSHSVLDHFLQDEKEYVSMSIAPKSKLVVVSDLEPKNRFVRVIEFREKHYPWIKSQWFDSPLIHGDIYSTFYKTPFVSKRTRSKTGHKRENTGVRGKKMILTSWIPAKWNQVGKKSIGFATCWEWDHKFTITGSTA